MRHVFYIIYLIKTEDLEISYSINTTMHIHGRGLLEVLTIKMKSSLYESNSDELDSIYVTTATMWFSWRDLSESRTTILVCINSTWTCFERPSSQSLYRLKSIFNDTWYQLLKTLKLLRYQQEIKVGD